MRIELRAARGEAELMRIKLHRHDGAHQVLLRCADDYRRHAEDTIHSLQKLLLEKKHKLKVAEALAAERLNLLKTTKELCCICLDNPRSYLFAPCGHRCVCGECYTKWCRTYSRKCPICNEITTTQVRVYGWTIHDAFATSPPHERRLYILNTFMTCIPIII